MRHETQAAPRDIQNMEVASPDLEVDGRSRRHVFPSLQIESHGTDLMFAWAGVQVLIPGEVQHSVRGYLLIDESLGPDFVVDLQSRRHVSPEIDLGS